MRNQLIKEILSNINNKELLDQFTNSCNFNNINYLAIIESLHKIKDAKYTDLILDYNEFKNTYYNILSDYFDKIDNLENFRINQCSQVENFLDMEKEMEEKIKDQVVNLAKDKSLINILPNLGNRINKNNLAFEIQNYIDKAVKYIKQNYTTFHSMNNFIFNGLSQSELSLIDS